MKSFRLILIASDRLFYNGPCVSLTLPGMDGEWGILADHVPMVIAVVPGELRFTYEDGHVERVAVGAGIAQIDERDVLVLADTIERPEEIDANAARRAMEDAQEALRQQQSQREYRMSRAMLAKALGQLKVKSER